VPDKVVFVHCVDLDTALEVLYEVCCCHVANHGLPCNLSPLDPEHSIDLSAPSEEVLDRIRRMPGVMEVAVPPAGMPELRDPETMRQVVLSLPWSRRPPTRNTTTA
jgi:hypothetical protein